MNQKLRRRLLPLYIAAFFQGFILGYAVDKLLATSVGLSASGIAMVVAVMSILTVVSEIPSGVLADRWSRKGVLYISQFMLGLSMLIGVFAAAEWHYWMLALAWGVFYAMYSGVYEAIVYDTLLEEQGDAKGFDRAFGRVGQLDGTALIISSIAGGLVASRYGIHAPYTVTLISIAIGLFAISLFKEPKIHKSQGVEAKLLIHIKQTIAAVRYSDVLKSLLLVSAVMGGGLRLMWEFSQMWYIELGLPVALFGIFNASLMFGLVLRGWLIPRISINRFKLLILLLAAGVLMSGFMMVPNAYIAAVGVTLLMICLLSAELVLKILQQDRLPSRVRAGATSVLSTVAHLISVPAFLAFGYLIDKIGISRATVFVTLIFGFAAVLALKAHQNALVEAPDDRIKA